MTYMYHVGEDFIFTSYSVRPSRIVPGAFMVSKDGGSKPWGSNVQRDGMRLKDALDLAERLAKDEARRLETGVERNFADQDIPV